VTKIDEKNYAKLMKDREVTMKKDELIHSYTTEDLYRDGYNCTGHWKNERAVI
jgi:hypothetical protein